ncbi:MFS general substrate transporter [Cladorrhinum samala]|uniref:MFS general substrate transporter n=1 Tax=Cladorrhinum samala TaxID=585594 RepID=A0AAV9HU91_9PEZI|nr:MFS general substrate transporter [Cladorrhinum samala]
MVFVSLCLASFLAALDVTIITTALPTITQAIGGEDKYVWIANSYVITSTAIQPLFGQLSNIFGRRYVTLAAVSLFLLGSGLSGGAVNVGMLIVGRCIQGAGSGAIMMLLDLIICDLVPLRERAKYIGIVMSSSGVSAALGPLIGGAIVQTISWRWIFYINLPIGGLVLVSVVCFLNTKHNRSPTWVHALGRIDFPGNFLFIASVVSLLLGLIMGGQIFPWSSWRIILPIVLGAVGIGAFIFYESTPLCKEPTIPLDLFGNRTSAIAYVLTFLSAMLLQWATYYLPIYFQGVQLSSPTRSGVQILPLNTCLIPLTIIAGIIVSATGKYLPVHVASFALMSLAFGLFTRLDADTSTVEWVFLQIVAAAGLGFTMNSPLTALQASLPDSYSASATATYAFLRSFAFVWGITIPAIIFNAQVDKHLDKITDAGLQELLSGGAALSYTTKHFLLSLSESARNQAVSVFTDALKISWYVSLAFALLGFVLCFGEKQIELRTTLDTEFGLDEGKKSTDGTKPADNNTSGGAV